jgi:hypothetical protein
LTYRLGAALARARGCAFAEEREFVAAAREDLGAGFAMQLRYDRAPTFGGNDAEIDRNRHPEVSY